MNKYYAIILGLRFEGVRQQTLLNLIYFGVVAFDFIIVSLLGVNFKVIGKLFTFSLVVI